MDYIDEKDGNRKLRLITCKCCGREWPIRKDREHSGYCKKCKFSGEKNPQYGKEAHNKGQLKYGMSYTKYRWIESKKDIIRILGNECCECKTKNMPIYCYEVHHTRPEIKKFSVLSKLANWTNPEWKERMLEELKYCKLICKNCHSVLHYGKEKLEDN